MYHGLLFAWPHVQYSTYLVCERLCENLIINLKAYTVVLIYVQYSRNAYRSGYAIQTGDMHTSNIIHMQTGLQCTL